MPFSAGIKMSGLYLSVSKNNEGFLMGEYTCFLMY